MSKLLGNLVKIALGAGAIYVAYKVGESNGKNKQQDVLDETKSKLETEIEFIKKLIQEYDELQNKTQKAKFVISKRKTLKQNIEQPI
jgi:glutamate synthase domain-containing protein 3